MADSTPIAAARRRLPESRRKIALVVLVLSGAGVALGVGWVLWRAPPPPEVNVAGVDPAIVEAIDAARGEIRAAPRSAAAWGRLGMVLRAHDFGVEANACFAEAQRLDADDPRWPYLQGVTLVLADRDAAIPLLERAADRCGNNPAPRLRLAEVLLLQGRLDEADRHFRSVVRDDRDHPRAHLGLARLAQRRGSLQEALDQLRYAAASPLTQKAAVTLRAEVRQQLGDTDQSREDLRQAAALPDNPPWPDPFIEEVERLRVGVHAQMALAERLFQQGRSRDAVALLEETARGAPKSDAIYLALGHTLLRLNEPARAEDALRVAIALAPNAAEAHFQLGNALFFQAQPGEAARSFREAIRLKPAHALAHYNLGHCLLRQGDRSGAAAAFREALRYQPNHADSHTNLADLLAQEGKDAEALTHAEEAVQLAPANERARKLLAEIRSRRPPGP